MDAFLPPDTIFSSKYYWNIFKSFVLPYLPGITSPNVDQILEIFEMDIC
jgi:hypothetical protein